MCLRRGSASSANLNKGYVRVRQVKSAEELDWLRIGAHFSDLGMMALRDGLRPGSHRARAWRSGRARYVAHGGSKRDPLFRRSRRCAKPQLAVAGAISLDPRSSQRTISCSPRSARRSGTIQARCCARSRWASRTPLYRGLHAVADAAFDAIAAVLRDGALPAQVIDAARVIEDAGFTTIDDLLHGYGGGYLPPILGSASRPAGPVSEEPFSAGMTVVIQPNVVTRDGKAGVQTGEMVLITDNGIERVQTMPRGFAVLS
jgi:Xaa-Pro aminopeptidase